MITLKAWQKKILRRVFWIAFLVVIAVLFVYSPFYSRAILWGLNKVPVTVNQVAAASQQGDGLIIAENLPEPGSPEWVEQEQKAVLADQADAKQVQSLPEAIAATHSGQQYQQNNPASFAEVLTQLSQEQQAQLSGAEKRLLRARAKRGIKSTINNAHAIVVLGGGLTRDKQRHIIVNAYTRLRLEKALSQKNYNPLPILLSGVEAPYMQEWLGQHGVNAKLLEGRSMNTCENTRFSALLLQKKGGAPLVELVTDAYHMPRARRLFAINGVDTIAVVAPLPNTLTEWIPGRTNLMHSRRATYEAMATLRDLWVGETNCREIP